MKNLADSLGFCARMGGGTRYCKALGRDYSSWCVTISGELDRIPVKIARKKVQTDWSTKTSHKDWGTIDGVHPTVVSSLKITSVGEGDYISITTDPLFETPHGGFVESWVFVFVLVTTER